MEIKDIVGKKVAIWCDTGEKAESLLEILSSTERCFVSENTKTDSYATYGKEICYRIVGSGKVVYASKAFYSNYEIISYNDFFGITEQVESVQDELTQAQILEWFAKNYYNDTVCEKALGNTGDFEDLVEEFGAEEIINRINAYERKNRKTTVSDEEITTLLDEKYGVGKWVRE